MNWVELSPNMNLDIEAVSGLVERVGTSDFDIALLHFVNTLSETPILEVCGYILEDHAPPRIAGWCGVRADTADRVTEYAEGLYEMDPALQALPAPRDTDTHYATTQTAESLERNDYRATLFDAPGFKADLSIVRREKDSWNISKFYLDGALSSVPDIEQIGQIGAFVYAFGKRHALHSDNTLRDAARPKAEDRLLNLLENRFPQLTLRERQVCALTILGNSTNNVADLLSISPNTVITYRQRVYDRLGVSSTNSLIRELI